VIRRLVRRGDAAAVALWCALAAVATSLATVFAAQGGTFSPSALVKMATSDPIAPYAVASDRGFRLVTPAEHYDGVYYYAIARDPFARGTAHTLIDEAPYRYGHPLHGWLANVLSGGRPALVPAALLALSLVGAGLAGWAASRLSTYLGGPAEAGLLVAFSPGLLYAATVSTTETLGAALVLCALLAWQTGRWLIAAPLLAMCCLDKEPYIALPVGLAMWELIRARRCHCTVADLRAKLLALAIGPSLLLLWLTYVHERFGRWAAGGAPGNVGRPIAGWLETFGLGKQLSSGSFEQSQIGAMTAPMLVALAALLVAGAVVAVRMRSVLAGPFLLLAAITSCEGWRTLLYPHEMMRIPAVVTLLAALVLLTAPRRGQGTTVIGQAALRTSLVASEPMSR
jgi:hypothetical protein